LTGVKFAAALVSPPSSLVLVLATDTGRAVARRDTGDRSHLLAVEGHSSNGPTLRTAGKSVYATCISDALLPFHSGPLTFISSMLPISTGGKRPGKARKCTSLFRQLMTSAENTTSPATIKRTRLGDPPSQTTSTSMGGNTSILMAVVLCVTAALASDLRSDGGGGGTFITANAYFSQGFVFASFRLLLSLHGESHQSR